MRALALALLLAAPGCALRYARTHACADTCPRVVGAGSRDLMPGGPVNSGYCFCSWPGHRGHRIVHWER